MADVLEPNAEPDVKAQVEQQLMEMLGVQDASREEFEGAILDTLRMEQEAHKELSRQLQYQSKTETFYAGACGIGAGVASETFPPAALVLAGVGAAAGAMAWADDMQSTYHANEAADLSERIAAIQGK